MEVKAEEEIFRLYARPACCDFSSMATLYAQFESIFLASGSQLTSKCGHTVSIFDHHFWHVASIRTADSNRLFMAEEKEIIRSTIDGFGKYIIDHGASRAKNLPSAHLAISEPDEVWEDNPKVTTAKWVYVKQFEAKPYPFTVALLTDRPDEGGIIVPVSSFPCTKSDVRKWRQTRLIYSSKQIQPPEGG